MPKLDLQTCNIIMIQNDKLFRFISRNSLCDIKFYSSGSRKHGYFISEPLTFLTKAISLPVIAQGDKELINITKWDFSNN